MSGENENNKGDEMKNEAKNMSSNVHAIGKHIDLDEPRKKQSLFVRVCLLLGLMHNPNEPKYSGATIVLAIVALSLIFYLIINAAVGRLDEKDLERGKYGVAYNTAIRNISKVEAEQKKRAELLELFKKKGMYQDVPEYLKTFESIEFDRTNLEQDKEKK